LLIPHQYQKEGKIFCDAGQRLSNEYYYIDLDEMMLRMTRGKLITVDVVINEPVSETVEE